MVETIETKMSESYISDVYILYRTQNLEEDIKLGKVHYFGGEEGRIKFTRENVKEGFVNPLELEIIAQNTDGSGKCETLLAYKGREYSLGLDEQGTLKIQEFVKGE